MHTRDHGPTLEYITRTFVNEPAWIRTARMAGDQMRPGMQVSAYEGHLLHWLLRMAGAQTILEIGTFMGTSTLWMAHAAGENGRVTALEFNARYAEQARAHVAASPYANHVEIIHTDAHAWLATRPLQPTYDLVFIDAEKSGYAAYLEAVIPRLNPRGWVVGDNTLLFGAMAGDVPKNVSASALASMQQFNGMLAQDARFESVLLPTPEGLTVARLK